ncbi:hypothetical protein LDENG_00287940 [Lucifuga dentata]|nr:hypothetical protein LDENG_00287940 [Lucifuga dentata]
MSRSFNMVSAWTTDALAWLSWESLKVNMTVHFATLTSSTTDDSGSCSWPDLMYSPADVKLGGIPSHLGRCLWIFLFTSSTHDRRRFAECFCTDKYDKYRPFLPSSTSYFQVRIEEENTSGCSLSLVRVHQLM